MKRIKLVLAVVATMAALLTMYVGPAAADSWDNSWNGDNWDNSWNSDNWDDNCIGMINSEGSCIGIGEGLADVWNSWDSCNWDNCWDNSWNGDNWDNSWHDDNWDD
jgi:hypothetical protein